VTNLVTRRDLIFRATSSAVLPMLGVARASLTGDMLPLKLRAERKGLFFGCGASTSDIESDASFRSAIVTDCSEIVPTAEMKWGVIEPREGHEDFSAADTLVDFAIRNGLKIRGHTAVWYRSMPGWAERALRGPNGTEVLESHIRGVLGHFGNRIASWDVVNEALWPPDGLPGGFRNSIFYQAFGPLYVQRAFEIARQVLPKTPLFYNDFGLEYDDKLWTAKREVTLQLLTQLKRLGLIDGLGIQSHLHVGWGTFDPKVFQRFLKDVADLGLEILLTEFDVDDRQSPSNTNARDSIIAAHARLYLDAAFDEKAVKGLIVWGLSDRNSWLNTPPLGRRDGLPSRGQPLDQALNRKALWHAIGESFEAARQRAP
jgi:endo-1,4-beta-xylanase